MSAVAPEPAHQPEQAGARRLLYVFPIIHGPAELGALAEKVEARRSPQALEAQRRAVGAFWDRLESAVSALALDWTRVRLYQDGLPVCGRELPIVEDLARAGSRNHRLLLALIAQGARLEGTESPPLLLAEYALQQRLLAGEAHEGDREEAARLLAERDAFIARRIAATLQPGEVGLLFLGAMHHIDSWLDTDIILRYPLIKPISRRGEDGQGEDPHRR